MMVKIKNRPTVMLLACYLVLTLGIGLGMTGTATAQDRIDVEVDVPTEATVDEEVSLSATVSAPDRPRPFADTLTVTFYSDGEQIGTASAEISDGGTKELNIFHTFDDAGEKDIEAEASVTFGKLEFSGSGEASLDIEELIEGKLSLDLIKPDSPVVTDESTTTVETDIPIINGGNTGDLTVRFFVDGQEVASKSLSASSTELIDTDFKHTFETSGETPVKIEAELNVNGRTSSKTIEKQVDVQPLIEGEISPDLTKPDSLVVGDEATTSIETDIPTINGGNNGELTVRFFVDGQEVASKSRSASSNKPIETDFEHTFDNVEKTPIRVEAELSVLDRTVSQSTSTTVDVSHETTTVKGAAFAVPESLEDEVENYRDNIPLELNTHAFILATSDDLHIVFTQKEPTAGVASVKGIVVQQDRETENLSYDGIAASSVSFQTMGREATLQEVANNPGQYRLEMVQINSHYRRISSLTDQDGGDDFTLSTTSGVLVENPQTAVSLFKNLGSNARALSRDSSTEQAESILNDPRGPRLRTVSFETEYWTDAEAKVDAIVLDPQSAAQRFINEYDQAGVAHAMDGEPILYVVDEDFHPQQFENVGNIKSQSESLDGEVVETEVRLYQEQISVQETLEHNTGCENNLLEIQTPQGPVCVNVAQDNLLHGGVAWNSVPQSRDDALLVMGVSSLHQDSPEELEQGRYRIEGEVVSTSRINESLPEGSVLVIYDMERLGDIDYEAVAEEARGIIETRTGELTTQLRQQVGENGIEIATGRTTETIQSAIPGEPATVSFLQSNRGSVSIQRARINVSTQVENAQINVAEVSSLPSGVSQPPGQSIRILNISSSIADGDINNASFQLRISAAAIPDEAEVTVSRYHDIEWNTLNTNVVEETDNRIVLNVETPGLSYFAVGTQSTSDQTDSDDTQTDNTQTDSDDTQTNNTQTDSDDEETEGTPTDGTQTGEEDQKTNTQSGSEGDTATETSDASGPGFTLVTVLTALMLFVGWKVRR